MFWMRWVWGGTVFKITTQGVKTTLYNFTGGIDGAITSSVLLQDSDGNFYGTTQYGGGNGGVNGAGTVFKLSINNN